jgi:hypothetical protein
MKMTDKQATQVHNPLGSEKVTLGFLADVLFLKGVLCYEEYEAIQNVRTHSDVEDIVEGMLRSTFNQFKRGEHRIVRVSKERGEVFE